MKQIIINADDLGICESTNEAIALAHREGVLTSASLMANGPAYEQAVENVVNANPNLGIGLHLCLTSGRSVCSPEEVALLVDWHSRFRHGFLSLYRLVRGRNAAAALAQIEREWDAQFLRLQESGVRIDHVNSHRHVHMIPELFDVAVRLAQQYGCPAIRLADEPWPGWHALRLRRAWDSPARPSPPFRTCRLLRNAPKKIILSRMAQINRPRSGDLLTADRTFGILGSGRMDSRTLMQIIPNAGDGVTEILTHPGRQPASLSEDLGSGDRQFLQSADRQRELSALCESDVRHALDTFRYRTVTFQTASTTTEPSGRSWSDSPVAELPVRSVAPH